MEARMKNQKTKNKRSRKGKKRSVEKERKES